MATKNLSEYNIAKVPDASNMCFGIVVSEWNDEITGALLDGCVSTLEKHGAIPENIHVKTVPGSFELIYGAHQMTLNDGFDAVIILGCVIRGETPHFDYICQGVTAGIARLNATSLSSTVCSHAKTSSRLKTVAADDWATKATNVPWWLLKWLNSDSHETGFMECQRPESM